MLPQSDEISDWFEKNVRCNETELRAFLLKKIPNESEVEDLIQETYARIMGSYRTQSVWNPRALLFRIARNLINDTFRKKYAANTIFFGEMDSLNDYVDAEGGVVENALSADDEELLYCAIKSLPKKCRAVILLRNFEKLSYREIANELNISVKTVETQMAIGMKKCRKYFESHGFLGRHKD